MLKKFLSIKKYINSNHLIANTCRLLININRLFTSDYHLINSVWLFKILNIPLYLKILNMKNKFFNCLTTLQLLVFLILILNNVKAQTLTGCDPCATFNLNKAGNFDPVLASTNSSSSCVAVTDYQTCNGNWMDNTWNSSCDASGTNSSPMWVAFAVSSSNVTGGGMNFSTSLEGQFNYDNLSVTIYRANLTLGGGGSCSGYTFVDSVQACSASTTDPSLSVNLLSGWAGSTGSPLPATSGSNNWYFARIYQRTTAAGVDSPQYIKMCAWTYDATKVNPCQTPPAGTCGDLTPNKDWGTKSCPSSATNDITQDWCFATGQSTSSGAASCSSTSTTDIKCTTGNSTSTWGTFEYNGGNVSDFGYVAGFNVSASGSGIGGKSLYGQVYTFASPACPIGGCYALRGNSFDMDVASIGLTTGAKYYLRVWATGVATTATVTDYTAKCALKNLTNDKYKGAQQVCSDHAGVTTTLHVTSNGGTCGDKGGADANDCGMANGCGGLVKFLSSTGGCSNNTNTNDTWFKFCAKNSGTVTLTVPSMSCAGTTGTQFWLMGEGTNGKNFCDADHVVEYSGWDDFATPSVCSSTGTTASFSLTSALTAGKCYYMLTDGYRGDYCDYNLAVTCNCAIVSQACLADNTGPTIVNVTATNVSLGSTFDLTLSEPVRCCYINAADFSLSKALSSCNTTGYSITAAAGLGCNNDGCSDTTRTIRVTVSPTISTAVGATNGCTYDNKWKIIVNTASTDIYDQCANVLTADSSTIILPVELMSFTGRYNEANDEVILDWKTASENNISKFIVERSPNAKKFEELGRVDAAGNSTTIRPYTLTDKQPFSNLSYYRLLSLDIWGNTSNIGDVIFVKTGSKFKVNSVHPIPATDVIVVDFEAGVNDKLEVKIYDALGKLMLSEKMFSKAGENSERVDINNLSKGVYIISLFNDGRSAYQSKIVKY